jgi:hypothetical protein
LSVLLKCLSFGEEKYYNLPNLHHLLQNFGKMGESLDHWISQHGSATSLSEFATEPLIVEPSAVLFKKIQLLLHGFQLVPDGLGEVGVLFPILIATVPLDDVSTPSSTFTVQNTSAFAVPTAVANNPKTKPTKPTIFITGFLPFIIIPPPAA